MADEELQIIESYRNAEDALYAVSGMVLLSFARNDCDTKNIIIRNFVARSAMTLKSIFTLWDNNDFHNAWVIHRALIDRMFHLHSIGNNDEFLAFDDWSFFEQYKAQNRVKSDEVFKNQANGGIYDLSDVQKVRIRDLEKKKPNWKRPKAETVAKKWEWSFYTSTGMTTDLCMFILWQMMATKISTQLPS